MGVGYSVGIGLGAEGGMDAIVVAIASSILIPGVGTVLGRQAVTINTKINNKKRKYMRRLYTFTVMDCALTFCEGRFLTCTFHMYLEHSQRSGRLLLEKE